MFRMGRSNGLFRCHVFKIPNYIKLLYSSVSQSSPFVASLSGTSSYCGSGNGYTSQDCLLFVFLASQPIVVVFSQPGSGL